MKPLVFSLIPLSKEMLSTPSLLTRSVYASAVMGVVEGVSLFLLVPAISALFTDESVWGLSATTWVFVLIGCAIVSGVIGYVRQQRGYAAAIDMLTYMHRAIGDQVAKLPLGWFDRPVAGRLSRMVSTELMVAGEIIAHLFSPLISYAVMMVVLLVLTIVWDVRLGLLLAVTTPLFLVFVAVSSQVAAKGKRIAEPAELEVSDRIVEFTHCQAALRATGQSENYTPLVEANKTWRIKRYRELWYEIFANMIGGAFAQVVVISLIILVARLALGGSLHPVVAIAYMGLALRYTEILLKLAEGAIALETRRPLLDAIHEVLNSPPLPQPETSAVQPTPGSIDFEHVDFGYKADTPVLRDVSFHVAPRTMVALVGPSGCGKTTVARLASRFYEVDNGSVKIGGVDVRDLRTETLMEQLSMVFQDVYLFDDTLIANIRIGRPDATDDEVVEAGRVAGVQEIVNRLPDGWETHVGEGGTALSGGERQRVAIARALLKQAPIVLLDEATSALDPENEANIVTAINKLRENATVLIIAHKLHTIAQADQIVTLNHDGSVEDHGTHDELFARGGTYRSFWDKRAHATGWRLT